MVREPVPGKPTNESFTETIVRTVADREGVEPTEIPPLHDVVDPDALNAVFSPTRRGTPRNSGRVEFTYCGHEVVVRSDGRVHVGDGRRETSESRARVNEAERSPTTK